MTVVVLQHVDCEPAAAYADALREQGVAVETVDAAEAPWPLDPARFDGVVAMGGPMGVNDGGLLPWIDEERRFIGDAVRAGTPVLGVCLGAQLLAASLGAAVVGGPLPEIGVRPVFRHGDADGDPLLGRLPASFPALHWHSDTFELPAGATLLASSEAYPNQAFRVGTTAYGIQFHLEADAALVRRWAEVSEYRDSLARVGGVAALPELIADVERHEAEMQRLAHDVMSAWVARCLAR